MMKKHVRIVNAILFFMVVILSSCAAKPNCEVAGISDNDPGFWLGLYHGFILLFSLLGKICNLNIGIYATRYDGSIYWLGYLFGLLIFIRIITFAYGFRKDQ